MNDDVFTALAAAYRRRLLVRLLHDDSRRVGDLSGTSREVADAHEGLLLTHLDSGRHVAGADEDAIRAHHVHLPILENAGFVDWDRTANRVRRGPRFDEVRPILELLAAEEEESRRRIRA